MSAPRRVLWTIRGLGPGGAERLLVAHAQVRDRGAWAVDVAYTVPEKSHLVPDLEAEGVVVHPPPAGGATTWSAWLRGVIREREVAVVHSHSPAVAPAARVAALRCRVPHVYTEHNRWPSYRWPTRAANALTMPLDGADIAVSEPVRATVARPLRRRVRALDHGIDLVAVRRGRADRERVRRSLGVGPRDLLAVHVANMRREKAHATMLDAVALLRDAGAAVQVRMVGQGPLEGEVREAIDRRGLGSHVQALGFRADVLDLVAAADVLALSSDHEGLPVAVMEALALGTPVVATAVGGLPGAVGDGDGGLLVGPGDPAALAGALRRVAEDPPLLHRLAAGARARGDAFDAARAVREIEDVYRTACDGGAHR